MKNILCLVSFIGDTNGKFLETLLSQLKKLLVHW